MICVRFYTHSCKLSEKSSFVFQLRHYLIRFSPRVRSHVQRRPGGSLLTLIAGSTAVGLTAFLRQYGTRAHCAGGGGKIARLGRTDAALNVDSQPELPFPWREFFRMLLPDIWVFDWCCFGKYHWSRRVCCLLKLRCQQITLCGKMEVQSVLCKDVSSVLCRLVSKKRKWKTIIFAGKRKVAYC